jgi:hypothetical protein
MSKIHEAMTAVMRQVRAVGKDRKNQQQNYNFRGIDDVANELHGLFAEQGIYITPRVLKTKREVHVSGKGSQLFYTILKVEYVFTAEDGSKSDPIVVVGEGMDSGDKATNKAMSAAFKYAMIQAFAIPTAEPKDSEDDDYQTLRPTVRQHPVADPVAQTPVTADRFPDEAQAWETVIHFGKNKGVTLANLAPNQRAWYFDDWFSKTEKSQRLGTAVNSSEDIRLMNAIRAIAPLPRDKQETSGAANPQAAAPASWREEMTPRKVPLGQMTMMGLAEMARFVGGLKDATARQKHLRELALETALPELISACQDAKALEPLANYLDGVDSDDAQRPLDPQERTVLNLAISRHQSLAPEPVEQDAVEA